MVSSNNQIPEEQCKRFAEAINRHGYAFQNAVIKRAHELYQNGRSRWAFEAAEFPAEVNGNGTRIDFILWTHKTNYWLLAECKRVNPRLADWFFVRTSYVRRGEKREQFIAEFVQETPNGTFLAEGRSIVVPSPRLTVHRGFEVKTNQHGEPGSSREAIEEAASQIMKGVNGLANYLNANRTSLLPNKERILIPVIFTTAALWISETNLADADLETGNIDPAALKVGQVPYLFYQYHLSPGIKHRFAPFPNPQVPLFDSGLSRPLATEFIRTIPIVSATGVDQFLAEFDVGIFRPDPIDF